MSDPVPPGASVVRDPAELSTLFVRDRASHVYGLADLAEPWWSASTWWRRGDAVVGRVALLPSTATAFYAISPAAPDETLALLTAVAPALPPGAAGTGPTGLAEALATVREVEDLGPHRKLVVDAADLVHVHPPTGTTVVELGDDDAADLADLHDSDPGAVFHLDATWADGHHLGVRDADGRLVAAAGTHVVDRVHDVAAIGAVITHPSERGRGLAAAVVSALTRRLTAAELLVGLNVADGNDPARRLYDRLGFRTVHRYDEARLR